MIEASSGLPRKASAIFGNLWKFSEIFGNVCVTFGKVLANLRKSSENRQERRQQYVYIIKKKR